MAPLFVDPGLLRRRAILERPVETSDGAGGARVSWVEVAELSIHVEPVTVAARERFEAREMRITHRVTCRRRDEVQRGARFRFGERRLAILAVSDPDETGRYLVCRCEEAA
ncbi:phage head closure protein [Aurantimonas sp. Leaf443]|uniref:phage head closure protein n=1 Tax=Aurantimonas sp. Leaf443 TaxID=1736378 RepID=UPI0006F26BDB|nr:phage head closure protein [Aurantimonas sp. Leaf443]KQT88235.1 hypothetical protein ASG48_02015 [Aurantimonas sp. Leaf443]